MKKYLSLFLILILLFSTLISGCTNDNKTGSTELTTETTSNLDTLSWSKYKEYNFNKDAKVKNIILMIGDGMGENFIYDSQVIKGDKLIISAMPYKTHVSTDSLDGTTDSAAASTAMSCGIKTYNKYLGVDKSGKAVETICEFAKAKGMKTGLCVTQKVNDATPAGMVAHVDFRNLFNVITKQEIIAQTDVIFGGGSEYHTKSVSRKLKEYDYKYIEKENELSSLSVKDNKKVLGMFSYLNINAGKTPSLATMTDKALELLQNDNGFFLMVEGSNIDVKLSAIDFDGAIKEMQSFEQSVDVALDFAEKNEGTLVIVTADHETGGVNKISDKNKVSNELITSKGEHTNKNVLLFAAGAQSDKITEKDLIENTDISKYMRKFLDETYGKKKSKIMNEVNFAGSDEPINN